MSPSPTFLVALITIVVLPLVAVTIFQMNSPPPPLDFGHGGMFDRIAGRYDLINRILALSMDGGWRKRLAKEVVSRLPPKNVEDDGYNILDVATGTADVALAMAEELLLLNDDSGSFHIIGVDPSMNMMHVGRDKIKQRGFDGKIELYHGDARKLDEIVVDDNDTPLIPPSSFHAITMAFGIRNVPPEDRSKALCQLRSALRPDGILAIMEFSEPPPSNVLNKLTAGFIKYVVPFAGGLLSGRPKEYWHLQHSIKEFPTPEEFVKLLVESNCGGDDYTGSFVMVTDPAPIQLNFKSVQLYVAKAV